MKPGYDLQVNQCPRSFSIINANRFNCICADIYVNYDAISVNNRLANTVMHVVSSLYDISLTNVLFCI